MPCVAGLRVGQNACHALPVFGHARPPEPPGRPGRGSMPCSARAPWARIRGRRRICYTYRLPGSCPAAGDCRTYLQKSMESLVVRGATQHNLKNVSCELPRNQLVVITGPSGSGKSSLAFDTIYAEGQRRYVESLSAYARQFLDQLPKPRVESIEGLSPAIAIEQKGLGMSPRSTVRHGHRNRGLPALAVRAHRRSPLPEVRQGAARVHRARDRRLDLVPR